MSELQGKVYVDVKRAYMIRFKQSMSLTGLIGFIILNKSMAGKRETYIFKGCQSTVNLSSVLYYTPKLELS